MYDKMACFLFGLFKADAVNEDPERDRAIPQEEEGGRKVWRTDRDLLERKSEAITV